MDRPLITPGVGNNLPKSKEKHGITVHRLYNNFSYNLNFYKIFILFF